MKNKTLLKPLLYSVLILILLGTMVYQIAGNPEASVFNSLASAIGILFMGIVRTIQWLFAMLIALAVCLAFLFALFLGAIALFDKVIAAQMYQNLKSTLLGATAPFTGACCTQSQACASQAPEDSSPEEERYETIQTEISGIQEQLQADQQTLTHTLNQLVSRVETLEAGSADIASQQALEKTNREVQDATASLTAMQETISALQSSLDQTANQVNAISPDAILGDLPQRLQSLEEQQSTLEIPEPVDIAPLQNDIQAIQAELSQVQEAATKALQAASECAATPAIQEAPANSSKPDPAPVTQTAPSEQEDHRLFSYFDDPADREKLVQVVSSTLNKNMSYKQVLNLLVKEFGPVKGKIISSHPSLSKDFIRQCRKNHH
ncbi:MAG: hypothetical protein SD837_21760 [Candidatus Electrothrix scaldis]|nr:MAG: hypothetical protein SD837_21760 [Candidatus Electrothrix sp. GW3-3]